MMYDNDSSREQIAGLIEVVKGWTEAPLLNVAAAGCGFSFAEILSVPGASVLVGVVSLPYSKEQINRCIGGEPTGGKYLTLECATELRKSVQTIDGFNIGITGALATSRERKGDDKAYVSIQHGSFVKSYELKFRKLGDFETPRDDLTPEGYRYECDKTIFDLVITIYFKIRSGGSVEHAIAEFQEDVDEHCTVREV